MGMQKNVVDFAHEIIEMQKQIYWLEKENQRLKEFEVKYNELLDGSIEHSNRMAGNMLKAVLKIKK